MPLSAIRPTASSTAGRRVLVTGADGLIGRATTAGLRRSGWQVTALSREWGAPIDADRVLTGDAADQALVARAVADADAVVHLAAIPHPGLASPRTVFTNNTTATFTVLSEAAAAGVRRLVVASSINAFGVPMSSHPVQPAYYPLDEDSPVAHDDAYSLSKWVDEQTCRMVHSRWGADVLAVRFPLVRDHAALRVQSEQLASSPDLGRLGREGWSYLDLRDAVAVLEAGLDAPFRGAHVALAVAADVLPDDETTRLLDRFAPDVPRRADFPGRSAPVSTARAAALLGWRPRHSVHEPADVAEPARVTA